MPRLGLPTRREQPFERRLERHATHKMRLRVEGQLDMRHAVFPGAVEIRHRQVEEVLAGVQTPIPW